MAQENFNFKQVSEAKKLAAANSRIIETDFEVGNFVFVFDDRPAPGIPYKLRIPYKGPYRVVRLYDNIAVLAIGDDEKKVNITKIIKLRDCALPQRDLKGRASAFPDLLPT